MAKARLSLREFQQSLLDRMQAREEVGLGVSTLGVQIAGQNWLVEMMDIAEVMAPPPLTSVPLTKPWFRGVANVRGKLYCVADMAAYLRRGGVAGDASSRVLLVADRHGFNVALLVDRVLGLRDARHWRRSQGLPEQYFDEAGVPWNRLDVPDLLTQAEFLQVGV
ncbi:MAG: chemotaxis protein CheW [Pseudomonadota bacterium]